MIASDRGRTSQAQGVTDAKALKKGYDCHVEGQHRNQ